MCPYDDECWLPHVRAEHCPLDGAFPLDLDDITDALSDGVLRARNHQTPPAPATSDGRRAYVAAFIVQTSAAARIAARLCKLTQMQPLGTKRGHTAKRKADSFAVFLGAPAGVAQPPNFKQVFAPAAMDVHLAARLAEAPLIVTASSESLKGVTDAAALAWNAVSKARAGLKLRIFPSPNSAGGELVLSRIVAAFEAHHPDVPLTARNSGHTHQLHVISYKGHFMYGFHDATNVPNGSAMATANTDGRYLGAWGTGASAWGVAADDATSASSAERVAPKICRANEKLAEAFHRNAEVLYAAAAGASPCVAIDIGAAPGGWTHFLAESVVGTGGHVIAMDPAKLDAEVIAHPRVTHIAARLEDGLEQVRVTLNAQGADNGIRIVTCDANFRPAVGARALLTVEPLLAEGALCVLTMKNFVGAEQPFRDDIVAALEQLAAGEAPAMETSSEKGIGGAEYLSKPVKAQRAFELVHIVHLFANQSRERTAILRIVSRSGP